MVCGELPKTAVVGSEQESPAGELVETVSPMVPVKPFRPVRVIVEEPDMVGAFWLGITGPADIEKSVTVTVTVAVCGPAELLTPVMVTV